MLSDAYASSQAGACVRRASAGSPHEGLAASVLAGLAGVAMLELHCANFEALHVLVWHTLVVPVSGVAGAVVGWARAAGEGGGVRA